MAACGTSHFATKYVEVLIRKLGCFDFVDCKIASEITEQDLLFKQPERTALLCVSQSGETMDLLIPFRLAKELGLTRINVVNKVNSTLARENDCGVFINCGRELSVASTKAYTSQVVCLILVALWFAQRKSFNQTKRLRAEIIAELKQLSSNMQIVLDTCNYFSAHVSEYLAKSNEIMFLGEGLGEAVANEGSLKMKELTYLHCQCFNIMNISNGFLNFVKAKNGVPCIFIVLQDNK